jgi:hypothetical protein
MITNGCSGFDGVYGLCEWCGEGSSFSWLCVCVWMRETGGRAGIAGRNSRTAACEKSVEMLWNRLSGLNAGCIALGQMVLAALACGRPRISFGFG